MKKLLYICMCLVYSVILYSDEGIIGLSGSNKYKAVKLTSEIYKNMNRDLSGVYLKDSKNNNIPYSVISSKESFEISRTERNLLLINSFKKEQDFYFDYKIQKHENKDIMGTSIKFKLDSKNFFRNVELYGSYDNLNWVKITRDTLYRTPKEKKDEIYFDKEEKYVYFRLKLENNIENIELAFPRLIQSINNKSLYYFEDLIDVKFQIKNENSITIIEIEPLKNLKVKSIEILTNSIFKRKVSTSMFEEQILYNLEVRSEKIRNTTIDLSGKYLENDFKIYIENNANKSIDIEGIRVRYYFDYIVFAPKDNNDLKLKFSEEDKEKPIYDMEEYKSDILKENIDIVIFKEIKINRKKNIENVDTKVQNYKFVFNIIIIFIALLIGIFILKNLSIKTKK